MLTLQVGQYYVPAVEEAIHKDDSGVRFKIYIVHTQKQYDKINNATLQCLIVFKSTLRLII